MSFNPYEDWSDESHQDQLRCELIACKAMRSVLQTEKSDLLAERDALRALLREILDRINADIDLEDGKPVISDELFERAEEMCK